MSKKKEPRIVSSEKVAHAAGFFLVLFGLLIAFSPVSRLWGIAFVAYLPFGLASYLFFIVAFIAQGVCLLSRGRGEWKIPLRFWLGSLVLMLALGLLFPLIFNEPDIGKFGAFFEKFFVAGNERYGFFLHPEIFGGVLGFVLDGVMVPWTKFAIALPVLIAVFFLAFLLFFLPPIVAFCKALRARKAIERSRREKIAADEEKHRASIERPFNDLANGALPSEENPPVMAHERPVPVFRYERPQEIDFQEEEEESVSSPVRPALTKTKQQTRRFVKASTAPYMIQPGHSMEKAMPDVVAPGLPKEIPSPDPMTYRHNPIQHTGLQPAYILTDEPVRPTTHLESAVGFMNETAPFAKKEPILEEEPLEPAPSPVPAEVALPKQEPQMEEEAQEDNAYDFMPNLSIEPIVPAVASDSSIVPAFEPLPEEKPAFKLEEEPPFMEEEKEPVIETPEPLPAPVIQKAPKQAVPAPKEEQKPAPYIPPAVYHLPNMDLLNESDSEEEEASEALKEEAEMARETIDEFYEEFGVKARVDNITIGPAFTVYEIAPDSGVSVRSIKGVNDDLGVRLDGISARFTDRVPGTKNCSIEVPNKTRRTVYFREIMSQVGNKYDLMVPFGIDYHNELVQASLRKFVHMLVCGMTGSGKSVFMHQVICSLIMRHTPDELRFLLVDPKRVEFAKYSDIPHLLCPIVIDPKKAVVALEKLCEEMDHRYDVLYEAKVRDIENYNSSYAPSHQLPRMPYIVCVVDEYADLTNVCKDVHDSINRLAAKARSCGIHLIIATQRPSVDVISGTIKSNISTRVALKVKKDVDSMTIINQKGAESLLGYGDLLVDCDQVSNSIVRAQGCFIQDEEIDRICADACAKRPQDFSVRFLNLEPPVEVETPSAVSGMEAAIAKEEQVEGIYEKVKRYVMTRDYCSISSIQREFRFGYPRSSDFFRRLKEEGIIGDGGASNNAKGSPVLVHSLPEEDDGVLDVPDYDE